MSGKVNLADLDKEAQKEGLIGSGVFKPQEGANRIRLVAGPLKNPETFTDKTTGETTQRMRWLWYVIDRRDGKVKPYFMPHAIFKLLRDLQANEDWAFDDVPVPYDVTITANGAGTREVKYSIQPSPKRAGLTAEEKDAIAEKGDLEDFQQKIREKRGEPEGKRFDPDEIPF